MVGIVACLLKNGNAAPILLDCISQLEYRGYDSMGMGCYDDGKIDIRKGTGTISKLEEEHDFKRMKGKCGIAHLRWATYGNPDNINSHPHFNKTKSIAIAHTGIIGNYDALREELESEGYEFISDCDSETIAHLLDKFINENRNLEEAMAETCELIEGPYMIAAMHASEPNKLVATARDIPIYIASDSEKSIVASDIPAIIKYNTKFTKLNYGELAVITDEGIKCLNDKNETIEKCFEEFDYFEISVMDETDRLIENQKYNYDKYLRQNLEEFEKIEGEISKLSETADKIILVPTMDMYPIALNIKHLLESKTSIPIILDYEDYGGSSIFIFMDSGFSENEEIFDEVSGMSKTLGISQNPYSHISRDVDYFIHYNAPSVSNIPYVTYFSCTMLISICISILDGNPNLTDEIKSILNHIDNLFDGESFKCFYENYSYIDFYAILFDFIMMQLME